MQHSGKNFNEIAEIYGRYPLKENFVEIGNVALAKYGVQAELNDDDIIRIPFTDRLLYTRDEQDEIRDSDMPVTELKTRYVQVNACIELSDDPKTSIRDTYCQHEANPFIEEDFNNCCKLTDAEFKQSIILIETFLNAVVDCA